MSVALDALIFATGWVHVLLAPFTKVEESFNLHATHDVLMYGVLNKNLHNYDHFSFPGAVPRTFVTSIILAWIATPFIHLASWIGFLSSKFDIQVLVRLVLASLNSWTLCLIRRSVSRRFGRTTGLLLTLLTCTQFHYPFWMGRTIPNMFATIPVAVSTYLLVDRAPNASNLTQRTSTSAIALLTFAGVVLRAEVALLLAPLSLQLLLSRQITFPSLVKTGIISAVASICLTIAIDSYFWDKFPLWPEFSGIYFNVVEGKSSDWGTSPPLTYFTSFLPKLLLGSLPLSVIGFTVDHRIRVLLFPSVVFIAVISNLGHKEWRFIVYVVPVFNIAAARGCRWMVSRRKSSILGRLFFLMGTGTIVMNLVVTILFTKASMYNYPGGISLLEFHRIYPPTTAPPPHIHISNLAAQTGASLFLQLNSPPQFSDLGTTSTQKAWIYNKTEHMSSTLLSSPSSPFTHLISEVDPSTDRALSLTWRPVHTVKSFDRWAVNWSILRNRYKKKNIGDLVKMFGDLLQFEEKEKLWILERKNKD